jgi:hypothetical protein
VLTPEEKSGGQAAAGLRNLFFAFRGKQINVPKVRPLAESPSHP